MVVLYAHQAAIQVLDAEIRIGYRLAIQMEFFLGIGVLAAAIWLGVLWRYWERFQFSPIVVGGVATVLVGTVLGHGFFNTNIGPIPITLDRLLLGAVALVFLFRYLRLQEEFRGFDRTDIVVLGFLMVLTLSTFTHDWGFRDNLPISQLLFFVLLPVCLYFVIKHCHLSDRDLRFVFIAFSLLGVYLSLTAFAETREWTWAIFPKHISDPTVFEFLGRGRGPLQNPVANGMLIVVGCCCSGLMIPHVRKNPVRVGLAVAAVLIGCLGTYSTLTRIIWLSLVIALFTLTWAPLPRRGKLLYGSFGIGLGVLLILVMNSGALNSFKRDKHVSTYDMSKSAGLRVVFFVIAKDMFADKPLFGHGFGQYRQAKMTYLDEVTEGNVATAQGARYIQHNIILSFLTETGLIGAFFLLTLLGTFAFVGWTVWFDPLSSLEARQTGILLFILVAIFFVSGMVQDVTLVPMANTLLFFWAGLGSNLYRRRMGGEHVLPKSMPSLVSSRPVGATFGSPGIETGACRDIPSAT